MRACCARSEPCARLAASPVALTAGGRGSPPGACAQAAGVFSVQLMGVVLAALVHILNVLFPSTVRPRRGTAGSHVFRHAFRPLDPTERNGGEQLNCFSLVDECTAAAGPHLLP